MIVWEQFSEIREFQEQTGVDERGEPIFKTVRRRVSGRREVERPDVITAEEQLSREMASAPERERVSSIADIKAQMAALLVEQGLGEDVAARIQQLRDAYASLKSREPIRNP